MPPLRYTSLFSTSLPPSLHLHSVTPPCHTSTSLHFHSVTHPLRYTFLLTSLYSTPLHPLRYPSTPLPLHSVTPPLRYTSTPLHPVKTLCIQLKLDGFNKRDWDYSRYIYNTHQIKLVDQPFFYHPTCNIQVDNH